MWENWDAIREDGSRHDCSFNHYAFGCVGDFLYRRLLGIQNDGNAYDKVVFAPDFSSPLTSMSGQFECSWSNLILMGKSWTESSGDLSFTK